MQVLVLFFYLSHCIFSTLPHFPRVLPLQASRRRIACSATSLPCSLVCSYAARGAVVVIAALPASLSCTTAQPRSTCSTQVTFC